MQNYKRIKIQDCERFHKDVKHVLKFDVRSIRKESIELYVTVNFVAYQLFATANLQIGLNKRIHLQIICDLITSI